jgi:hypothetical protein
MHLVIPRLLELGIIDCIAFPSSPSGYAYTWTYMGRLCLKRLGYSLPPLPVLLALPEVEPVIADLSNYDRLVIELDASAEHPEKATRSPP